MFWQATLARLGLFGCSPKIQIMKKSRGNCPPVGPPHHPVLAAYRILQRPKTLHGRRLVYQKQNRLIKVYISPKNCSGVVFPICWMHCLVRKLYLKKGLQSEATARISSSVQHDESCTHPSIKDVIFSNMTIPSQAMCMAQDYLTRRLKKKDCLVQRGDPAVWSWRFWSW